MPARPPHIRCLLVLLAAGSACTTKPIDMSGLVCSADGECLNDYACDAVEGICVTTNDACDEEGRRIPCDPEQTTCTAGCRTCTGGVWSECEIDEGCLPDSIGCDGDRLVVCRPDGTVDPTLSVSRDTGTTSLSVPSKSGSQAQASRRRR